MRGLLLTVAGPRCRWATAARHRATAARRRRLSWQARATLLAVPLGLAALLLGAVPAQAHGDLVSGAPGPGDDVAVGTDVVQLEFEELDEGGRAYIALLDEDGNPWQVGEAVIADGRTVCARTAALPAGVHAVEYAVPAGDGHTATGRYTFQVSTGGDPVRTACPEELPALGEARTLTELTSGGLPEWAPWALAGVALAATAGAGVVVLRERRGRSAPR